MRFSRTLKSSTHSLPSPNGANIATIFPSKLSIRETRSLDISRVISLPSELSASINWFLWSPSSDRILVASTHEIRVLSISNTQFSAVITNPTSGTTKIAFVAFGASDNEVCVFSEFGLKLSVFNLLTSKSVDITAPKFYNPGVAGKGISYRPRTSNLALLTRSAGKDVVSIHARDTLEVTRSWNPDTIDAQGISWSPDGRWLAVWESASQGHGLLVYAADGYLYKTWNGPVPMAGDDVDLALGAGIKMFEWNKTGTHVAIGDYSRRVTILTSPQFTESMNILHTNTIKPTDSLKIWQEQLFPSPTGGFHRTFIRSTQSTCPPTSSPTPISTSPTTTNTSTTLLSFSGGLLLTRSENMPTTLWIWDISAGLLRAVLILHAPIAKATWHPEVEGWLLVRCEGEEGRGLVYIWDGEEVVVVDFESVVPGGRVLGRTVGRWLGGNTNTYNNDKWNGYGSRDGNGDGNERGSKTPSIFFSDTQDYILASLSTNPSSPLPWASSSDRAVDIYGQREESPLNLVAADEKRVWRKVDVMEDEGRGDGRLSGGSEEVDDTFRFKRFVS